VATYVLRQFARSLRRPRLGEWVLLSNVMGHCARSCHPKLALLYQHDMQNHLSYDEPTPLPEIDFPKPERLISGNPKRTTWNRYERDGVFAGEWACEVGAWRIEFGPHQHEYFQVISGRCRVTDDNGVSKEYGPGDSFVGGPGLSGTFEVIEPILKRYMIVDRPA
jgi:uncharacterized cupin superfamily protein